MLIRTQDGTILNSDRCILFNKGFANRTEAQAYAAMDDGRVSLTKTVDIDCADFVLRVLFEAARMGSPVFDVPKTIAQYEHECANMEAINAEEVPCVCER